jgi:WD40 repeat protein
VTGDRLREQTLPEVGYDDPSPTQDGQRLLLGSSSLTIFDLTTGQNVQTIPMPEPVQRTGFVYKRIISPDGRRIAATHSVDKQSTLLILDASDGKVLFSREGLDGSPRLFFSPDGKRLALSRNANDGFSASTWMLDADTGKELFTLEGCQVLDFSPDSQRVAATNRAGGFTIHSASARVSLIKSSEPGKPALIDQARFSPDGKWLAAMYSQRLTLFDAESGKQLRQLTLPTGLSNFAFAPDGRHLLAGSGVDGTIYVLRLAPPPPAE